MAFFLIIWDVIAIYPPLSYPLKSLFFSEGSESTAKQYQSDEEWARAQLQKKTNVRNFRSDAE